MVGKVSGGSIESVPVELSKVLNFEWRFAEILISVTRASWLQNELAVDQPG